MLIVHLLLKIIMLFCYWLLLLGTTQCAYDCRPSASRIVGLVCERDKLNPRGLAHAACRPLVVCACTYRLGDPLQQPLPHPVRGLPCCRRVVCHTSSSNVRIISPALRGLQEESTLTVPGGSFFTGVKSVQVLHPGCRNLSNWRRTELNCTVSVCARRSFYDGTNNRFDEVCITAYL